ncbi:probable splicing factor 3A subunit 1 [Argentina anserina]|uniref:probable splicing factor 3A subunit 1 n=1 Tax=Argentina anserina TaxID=57926 RepID=UPI0021762B38|nr:probable splicing factor 3A subunit 1 [Potentilla anserina]
MMIIGSISPLPAPPTSVATLSKPIGIIRPPPEIAIIINKTAEHVAQYAPEFEKVIISDEIKQNRDTKFSFLSSLDPYHAYYQNRVAEIRAQPDQSSEESAPVVDVEAGTPKPDFLSKPRPECKVPAPPEPEEFTVRLPQGIRGEEIDVIKLTAQFAARNGESFLAGLRDRERSNPMFYFLNRNHSLFDLFTSLRDAYIKVLKPPEGLTEKLKKSVGDMTAVLGRCVNWLEWEHYQEQSKQKAEDEIEQERLQMAAIDWHDSVVVEVLEFDDDDDVYLPPPMTLEEVIRRSKVVTYMKANDEVKESGEQLVVVMDLDEEEMQLVEEGMEVTEVEQPPMRIVKNWKRPEEKMIQSSAERDMTISPITGELVPNNEMSEHMRISPIDPRYKERMFAKIREASLVLAQDDEISRNIVNLARTRPDIFGSTEEEVSSAVKAEIEKKGKQQVIWDGHAGSIGRVANLGMSQNINGEDAAVNNEVRSLPGPARPSVRPLLTPGALAPTLPGVPIQYPGTNNSGLPVQFPSVGPPEPTMLMSAASIPVPPPPASDFTTMQMAHMPPPTVVMPPPPLPQVRPPTPSHAEPNPKRQKVDDSMLIPEDEFLAQHPRPISIKIYVPNVDEGNLRGQLLEIIVQSLSETVGSLKERISGEIKLPANKQKLSGNLGFLKDNLSLAYYNIGVAQTLSLSVRERGGRKR